MRARTGRGCFVLISALALIVIVGNPAYACWPMRAGAPGSGFSGWIRTSPGVTSTKANIRNYDPFVSSTSESFGFTMLQKSADAPNYSYGQVGWLKTGSNSSYRSGCGVRCTFTQSRGPAPAAFYTHYYSALP